MEWKESLATMLLSNEIQLIGMLTYLIQACIKFVLALVDLHAIVDRIVFVASGAKVEAFGYHVEKLVAVLRFGACVHATALHSVGVRCKHPRSGDVGSHASIKEESACLPVVRPWLF